MEQHNKSDSRGLLVLKTFVRSYFLDLLTPEARRRNFDQIDDGAFEAERLVIAFIRAPHQFATIYEGVLLL